MTDTNCPYCNGKGYYTQMFGRHYSADFIGDKSFTEKPTIKKVACSKCNKNNKLNLEGVLKNKYE